MWDGNKFEGRVIIYSSNFFFILFTSLNTKEMFIITNVYALTTYVGRKLLWSSLKQMREEYLGIS